MDTFHSRNSLQHSQLPQEELWTKNWIVSYFVFIWPINSTFKGAFSLYDVDKDGFITKEEMANVCCQNKIFHQIPLF